MGVEGEEAGAESFYCTPLTVSFYLSCHVATATVSAAVSEGQVKPKRP